MRWGQALAGACAGRAETRITIYLAYTGRTARSPKHCEQPEQLAVFCRIYTCRPSLRGLDGATMLMSAAHSTRRWYCTTGTLADCVRVRSSSHDFVDDFVSLPLLAVRNSSQRLRSITPDHLQDCRPQLPAKSGGTSPGVGTIAQAAAANRRRWRPTKQPHTSCVCKSIW